MGKISLSANHFHGLPAFKVLQIFINSKIIIHEFVLNDISHYTGLFNICDLFYLNIWVEIIACGAQEIFFLKTTTFKEGFTY